MLKSETRDNVRRTNRLEGRQFNTQHRHTLLLTSSNESGTPSLSESKAVGGELGRELIDGAELGANDKVGAAEGSKLGRWEGAALGCNEIEGRELGSVDGLELGIKDGLVLGCLLGVLEG